MNPGAMTERGIGHGGRGSQASTALQPGPAPLEWRDLRDGLVLAALLWMLFALGPIWQP